MTPIDSRLERRGSRAEEAAPAAARFFEVKGTSLGMWAMNAWARARHWLGTGLRVRGLDHVTIPCRDLAVAERFYIGVLGARVLMRVDASFLRRFGREREVDARAFHTSLVFSGGPRIDLFIQPDGIAPPLAGHPHHAFAVPPGEIMRWKKRLDDAGVPTFGPTRLGPPGQASLYFNDPSGNHLELVTHGFLPSIPVGPPNMADLHYEWRGA